MTPAMSCQYANLFFSRLCILYAFHAQRVCVRAHFFFFKAKDGLWRNYHFQASQDEFIPENQSVKKRTQRLIERLRIKEFYQRVTLKRIEGEMY